MYERSSSARLSHRVRPVPPCRPSVRHTPWNKPRSPPFSSLSLHCLRALSVLWIFTAQVQRVTNFAFHLFDAKVETKLKIRTQVCGSDFLSVNEEIRFRTPVCVCRQLIAFEFLCCSCQFRPDVIFKICFSTSGKFSLYVSSVAGWDSGLCACVCVTCSPFITVGIFIWTHHVPALTVGHANTGVSLRLCSLEICSTCAECCRCRLAYGFLFLPNF